MREKITEQDIRTIADILVRKTLERIQQKGNGAFVNNHEIWGVLDEEVDEFKEAVRENDPADAYAELVDIGVVSVFGLASQLKNLNKLERYLYENPSRPDFNTRFGLPCKE